MSNSTNSPVAVDTCSSRGDTRASLTKEADGKGDNRRRLQADRCMKEEPHAHRRKPVTSLVVKRLATVT